MKRSLSLLLVLATCGCGQIGFDIVRNVPEQTVTGDPVAHAAGTILGDRPPIPPFQIPVDINAEARAASTVVTRVYLKRLSFDITATAQPAGDTDCWDFVSSLDIQVESTRAGSTLPSVRVAQISAPGCVSSIALTVSTAVNLKPYIEEGFRVVATGTGLPPADDVSFSGRVDLRAEPF